MASLGRFIVRSGEKALPFFKLMKRIRRFEWTLKADKAFVELKRYLTSPQITVAPRPREPLLLYIAATPRTASAVLVTERDARVIAAIFFDAPRMGVPPEEEAAVSTSHHEESSHATSTAGLLPQDDPPEPPEEVTSVSMAKV
jgi:hypothetical protein